MPAEWEPHEATWLGWPDNVRDWPGRLAAVRWAQADLIRKLAEGEIVHLLVKDAGRELRAQSHLERQGVDRSQLRFHRIPTDRAWLRDCGPLVLRRQGPRPTRAVAGFRFNAWARYADFQRDARVSAIGARALGLPLMPVEHDGHPVVLEGGAIDVNGKGTVLATEECLLDPVHQVRNPGLGRIDYERIFGDGLGAPQTIWLGKGIVGDDTHGHVDDLARFVNPRSIVLAREDNADDPNHAVLSENRERLASARLQDGSRPEVIDLPMPRPLAFEGRRLPASYANFYVANAAVLVPTFNDPADRTALGILGDLFPDRPVVGIHALDLIWGLGTIHCLTQQVPRGSNLRPG